MADDREDDDTPPADSKSGRRPKKRFQQRDDSGDEEEDRPRKRRRAEEDDEAPRKKPRADDEDADRPKNRRGADDAPADAPDEPRRKRRRVEEGVRVKANDNIPILMLLAFIGSAVALLVTCVGCGWFSFDWLAGGSGGGSGGGWGNEVEITSVTRTQFRPTDAPSITWYGVTKQNTNTKDGKYYLVMKCGSQTVAKELIPGNKGTQLNGSITESGLRGSSGKLEVWIEKRPNPLANGKTVSNVFVVP